MLTAKKWMACHSRRRFPADSFRQWLCELDANCRNGPPARSLLDLTLIRHSSFAGALPNMFEATRSVGYSGGPLTLRAQTPAPLHKFLSYPDGPPGSSQLGVHIA